MIAGNRKATGPTPFSLRSKAINDRHLPPCPPGRDADAKAGRPCHIVGPNQTSPEALCSFSDSDGLSPNQPSPAPDWQRRGGRSIPCASRIHRDANGPVRRWRSDQGWRTPSRKRAERCPDRYPRARLENSMVRFFLAVLCCSKVGGVAVHRKRQRPRHRGRWPSLRHRDVEPFVARTIVQLIRRPLIPLVKLCGGRGPRPYPEGTVYVNPCTDGLRARYEESTASCSIRCWWKGVLFGRGDRRYPRSCTGLRRGRFGLR